VVEHFATKLMIGEIMKIFKILGLLVPLGFASLSQAAVIDFTGGTVTQHGGATGVTNNSVGFNNVDFYEEDGFKFDFLGPAGNTFSTHIGDYYGVGNDVIHGHWAAQAGSGQGGTFGDMTSIRVNKIDNTAFDLNYVKITTNTNSGGGPASGTEEVYINALDAGDIVLQSVLVPPDDWGFAGPNSTMLFGPLFDGILAFSITYGSGAVGIGLDEFFIDEPPPPSAVPVPAAVWLFGTALIGFFGMSRRRKVA
jgi:hypothetical protein